ncbi:MAG: hypothetical protein RMJ52_07420 [Gemmataceae bacterium]|nr:hypothetical protein [Gemmataceae bacterium]
MVEPAYIRFKADGGGELRFGCVVCGIDCDISDDDAEFTFQGYDEMDEVSGRGWLELNDNETFRGGSSIHLGDRSTCKVRQ